MPTYVVTGPDGKKYRVSAPEGATEADVMARVRGQAQAQTKKPTSFWQGFREEGGKAVANAMWLMDTLQGRNIAKAITGAPTQSDIVRAQVNRQKRNAPTQGSTAGRIAGGVVGTLPTLMIPGSGLTGAIAQGAAGGAMLSEDPNNPRTLAKDTALGAVGGGVGYGIGRAVAPVANRIGRTAPVRAVAKKVAQVTGRPALPAPRITKAERAVSGQAPDLTAVRQTIADAADLKLPFSLADADPRLARLAGSATRYSPDTMKLATGTLPTRARGQADRAINAIDDYLAPVTKIEQRAKEIMATAQQQSRPIYEEAFARAAPIDEEVAAMLQSPAGRSALQRAREIAMNEGRDPNAMGFDLNEQGEVILGQAPSFETLDLVKRGIDSRLNDFRNPITQQLDLSGNPLAQSVEGFRKRFVSKLDDLNEVYPQARATFAGFAKRKEALERGGDLARNAIPQRQFDAAIATMTPDTLPEAQRGYATAMADAVNRQRLSRNPYEAIYGSPNQQGQVSAMFPEGAQRFGRQYEMERAMADTANTVIGNSATQGRAVDDAMFQNNVMNDAADTAIQLATGGGLSIPRIAGTIARNVKDRSALGLIGARQKADAIGPVLLDTSNPAGLLGYLDDIMRKRAEEEVRRNAYARVFGAGGAGLLAPGFVASGQ